MLPKQSGPHDSARIIKTLNGLRGIAILLVLCVHLVSVGYIRMTGRPVDLLIQLMWMGWTGVDLFFVLSGFLITGILLDTHASQNYFQSFYMRRILRIFPLYYLVLFVTAVLASLFRSTHYGQYFPNRHGLFALVFYIQNYAAIPQALGHFWSLAVEEQFYLLWPFVIYFVRSRRSLVLTTILLALLSGVGRCFAVAMYGRHFELDHKLYWRIDTLLAGALLAMTVRHAPMRRVALAVAPWTGLASCLGFLWIAFGAPHEVISRELYTRLLGFPLLAVLFASIVLLAWNAEDTGSRFDRMLRHRFLQVSGKYSYGLYVFHAPIYVFLYLVINHVGNLVSRPIPRMLTGLLAAGLAYLVAFASFRSWEQPFLRLKERFTARTPVHPRHPDFPERDHITA